VSLVRKRSVSIRGHRTSFSLEDGFYDELERIAAARRISLAGLVAELDAARGSANLSSALRTFVLEQARSRAPRLVPELDVSDLERSLDVYLRIFGFECRIRRPEERFAYLVREDAHLMLEEAAGPGRRFNTAPLEPPFGRGMNLQIEVSDVDALHADVRRAALPLRIPLEERWYRQGEVERGNRQFVVADPDGYLLRFFSDLGERPAAPR
jgi:predicted DNA-binding ribbon-helix-helix protein